MQINSVMSKLQPQSITTDVLLEKYAKGNETTVEEIYERVATHLASVEKPESRGMYKDLFYNNMVDGAIGAGRIMSSAGTDLKATLINCFVVAVGDCIDGYDEEGVPGIYEALRQAACTMQKGGGVGYNFSNIRPRGSVVKSVDSSASGPCSYIDIFDASCKTIESAGCFAGDTLINTTDGLIPIKEIVESDKDFYAITHLGPKKITAKFKNGVKPLFKVVSGYGYSVKVTEDHKFAQIEQGEIVTRPLKELMSLDAFYVYALTPPCYTFQPTRAREETDAFFLGTFSVYRSEDEGVKNVFNLVVGNSDYVVPESILRGSMNVRAAYLAGCFDKAVTYVHDHRRTFSGEENSDGTRISYQALGVKTFDLKVAEQLQTLLSSLGVVAGIELARGFNGESGETHLLTISGEVLEGGKTATGALARTVGHPGGMMYQFVDSNDTDYETPNLLGDLCVCVYKLPPEETYDLEVEDVHLLSGNGLYTSNSRRGAQLGAINISHPDILEFIKAKRTKGRWNNFNVSVLVTDEFMTKKEKGEMFKLTHKATPSDEQIKAGAYFDDAEKVWVYSEISTTELWDEVMRSNYDYAEPGILFYDTINNDNNLHYVEKIETTNPCVTGDTLLITPKGYVTIESRVGKDTSIWNGFEWTTVKPKITGTNQPIYDLVFSDGTTLPCTPYHKFILDNHTRVEAKDLTEDHFLAKHALPIVEGKLKIDFESPHFDLSVVPTDAVKVKSRVKWLGKLIDVQPGVLSYGGVMLKAFNVDTESESLSGIKSMLALTGCHSSLRVSEDGVNLFIPESSLYTLRLLGLKSKVLKGVELRSDGYLRERCVTLVSRTKREGLEPKVYCFTDPINNSGVFNGIMTGNCGEVPLPSNGCCDLGPIILPKLVTDPFTLKAKFDYAKLSEMVKIQTRMLDNVLDATVWPLEEQRLEAMSKRRIGVGFTGLANALAMCGKTYYYTDGLTMADRISQVMRDAAYTASAMLAKEKGSFPLFDAKEFFKEGTSASRLPEGIKALINKYGIRNSHLLSIAPTGTVSLAFADNASNGIEPPFSFAYTRKKRVGEGHVNYNVLDHSFRVYLDYLTKVTGNDINSKALEEAVCSYQDTLVYGGDTVRVRDVLPKSMVTALEMTPDQHLAMMRVVQPYICQSISKTVNVPKECTFDDFKSIYDKAWLYRLKGVSTYKPNDILGSVLSVEKPVEVAKVVSEEKPAAMEAVPATTKELTAKIYDLKFESRADGLLTGISTKGRFHTEQGEQKFILTINFVVVSQPLSDGGILQIKRPVEFLLTSNFTSSSSVWQAAMRFISLMARSGVPIPKILENMREITWEHGKVRYGTRAKDGKNIPRWHNSDVAAIGYVIQEALEQAGCLDKEGKVTSATPVYPDNFEFKGFGIGGTEAPKQAKTGHTCPECGSTAMVKRDGCEVCEDCNYIGTCG